MTRVLRELWGLFVDDEFLAGGLVCLAVIAGLLSRFAWMPTPLIGLVLVAGSLALLAASVLRTANRTRS